MHQKKTALEFLKSVAKGEVRDAFAKFTTPGFRHHNAYIRADAASLMKGMEDSARENPGTALDVIHAVEEADIVAVHSHIRHKPADRGYAVCHLFRFEGGRIAELWDFAQEVPADMVNENGMF